MLTDKRPCTCDTDCGDDPDVRRGLAEPCRAMALLLKSKADAVALQDLLAQLGYADALTAVRDLAAIRAAVDIAAKGEAPDPLFVSTSPGELGEEITVRVDRRSQGDGQA